MHRTTLRYLFFLCLPLLACSLGQTNDTSAPTAAATEAADAPTIAPTETSFTAATAAPVIAATLGTELCRDVAGASAPDAGVTPGTDMAKLTITDPLARCNDGTPAIMYVKPGSGDLSNTWLFHFQGGGACTDYEVCLSRWCGTENYDASKMSSRFTPPGKQSTGLMAQVEGNPLRDANHVWVYYCSSDGWVGRADDVTLTAADGSAALSMHFRGHTIINAALDTLMAGATSDDGNVTMPPLQEAVDVLFTGTSAGAGGVTHNLDWLAGRFNPDQTRVVGIIDAGSRPLPSDFSDAAFAQFLTDFYINRATGFGAAADIFSDESCLAAGGDAWLCTVNAHVQRNHITTPFFVRMDLGDSLMQRTFQALGATPEDVANATQQHLLAVADARQQGNEAALMSVAPGIYGPACGQHVGLTIGTWYYETTLDDGAGELWTFNAAIQAWLAGETVTLVDEVPPTRSTCRQVDDRRD